MILEIRTKAGTPLQRVELSVPVPDSEPASLADYTTLDLLDEITRRLAEQQRTQP